LNSIEYDVASFLKIANQTSINNATFKLKNYIQEFDKNIANQIELVKQNEREYCIKRAENLTKAKTEIEADVKNLSSCTINRLK